MKIKNIKIKNLLKFISPILGVGLVGVGAYFGYKNFNTPVNTNNGQNTSKDGKTNQVQNLKNVMSPVNEKDLRIGFWNVVNISGNKGSQNEAVAKTILHMNLDIVGIVEVSASKYEEVAPQIINELSTLNSESEWRYITSLPLSDKLYRPNSNESSIVFYKSSKVKPILMKKDNFTLPNDSSTHGVEYENPYFESTLVDTAKEKGVNVSNARKTMKYARAPFGVGRRHFKGGKDFVTIFHHADSPGVNEKEGEIKAPGYKDNAGHFEVEEARRFKEVAKWFSEDPNLDNPAIIIMADTNLTAKNHSLALEPALRDGFESKIEPVEENNTSLGLGWNKLVNPYDKILVKGIKTRNAGIYNIFNVIKDKVLDDKWKQRAIKEEYDVVFYEKSGEEKEFKENYKKYEQDLPIWNSEGWETASYPSIKDVKKSKIGYKIIRNEISDHLPVYTDIIMED